MIYLFLKIKDIIDINFGFVNFPIMMLFKELETKAKALAPEELVC